jgi:hypothetical protein
MKMTMTLKVGNNSRFLVFLAFMFNNVAKNTVRLIFHLVVAFEIKMSSEQDAYVSFVDDIGVLKGSPGQGKFHRGERRKMMDLLSASLGVAGRGVPPTPPPHSLTPNDSLKNFSLPCI